jgi:class 3 adenylate cyclase
MSEQQICFCKNAAGVRVAYSTMGSGPPLVMVPGWTSHLEEMLKGSWSQSFLPLASHFTLVRYDKGGTGLSDRNLGSYSMDARLGDLEAVVNSLKLKKFALYAVSEGGPIAIAYAARHPRQVSRLALYGTYARGPMLARPEAQEALIALVRAAWGLGSETMTNLFMPGAPAEEVKEFVHLQRVSATKEDAAALLEAVYSSDVMELLPKVKAPTLVLHARGDHAIRYRHGVEVASGIPGAKLVTIESDRHVLEGEAGTRMMDTLISFLGGDEARASAGPSGMLTVMFTDMVDSTRATQELGDARAQELVRRHNTAVREALQAHGGHEVKHTGDGIMASFGTASTAIDCALAVQAALDGDAGSLRVRIGLNAGEPVAEEQDLFGAMVQMAARVCGQAEGGQVVVTNVVRELATGKGFRFSETGLATLKGFDDPVRLFEVKRG